MRRMDLLQGSKFAENELDPPNWVVARVWNGGVTLLLRDNPNETMGDLANEAQRICDFHSRVNDREVDRRKRKIV